MTFVMWFSFTMLNVEKCKVRDMAVSERSRMNDDDDDGILLLTVACILQCLRISFHFKCGIQY